MKNETEKLDKHILVPVISLFTLGIIITILSNVIDNVWANLTIGIGLSVVMSFVIYFALKKQK